MDVHFGLEALEEAIAIYGPHDIMNTDQGFQFTQAAVKLEQYHIVPKTTRTFVESRLPNQCDKSSLCPITC